MVSSSKFVIAFRRTLPLLCLFAAVLWLPYIITRAFPLGTDFRYAFRPAALALLAGQSPYSVDTFYSPPWVLLFYAPFALLPPDVSTVLLIAVGFIAIAYAAHKLGASPLAFALFLATPQTLWGLLYGNNDWMVALGTVLPPQIGLFFVLAKPQLGAPIALVWLVQAWRRGRVREVVRVFAPLAVVGLVFVALLRGELLHMLDAKSTWWNVAHFPYLIPVGLILLRRSILAGDVRKALTVGPFIAPYIGTYSLPYAVLGLLPNQVEAIIALVSLWVVWIVKGP